MLEALNGHTIYTKVYARTTWHIPCAQNKRKSSIAWPVGSNLFLLASFCQNTEVENVKYNKMK
jgi:hypothetical protein